MDASTLEQRIDTWIRDQAATFKRLWIWAAVTLALMVVVWLIAPQMVKVSLYKLSLITAAAWVGYRLDLAIGEPTRPHELLKEAGEVRAANPERAWQLESLACDRYKRRALTVAAVMIAAALGS